jgi:hypothetical protein
LPDLAFPGLDAAHNVSMWAACLRDDRAFAEAASLYHPATDTQVEEGSVPSDDWAASGHCQAASR